MKKSSALRNRIPWDWPASRTRSGRPQNAVGRLQLGPNGCVRASAVLCVAATHRNTDAGGVGDGGGPCELLPAADCATQSASYGTEQPHFEAVNAPEAADMRDLAAAKRADVGADERMGPGTANAMETGPIGRPQVNETMA